MVRAGWVLVGGQSTRMGRDKALLPYRGRTLVEHVASVVQMAAGSVTLVGNPDRYHSLGYRMIADSHIGCGPIGGLEAALAASEAEWNLVVACDMPRLSPVFLGRVMEEAERCGGDCLLPVSPSGRLEPLCAVYGRGCLPVVRYAMEQGVRKLAQALSGARLRRWPVPEAEWFENLNTPEEWSDHLRAQPGFRENGQ